MPLKQKPVEHLIKLLNQNHHLKDAVEISLLNAALKNIETLEDFYIYLEQILTHIPTEKELMPSVREFYFVLSKSPDDILRKDADFNNWINEFVRERGNFMNTIESTETLETFINNAEYKIDDYIKEPGGWFSYNQFLARRLKPGKRPVAALCDDSIIVSPADSEYMGAWSIADDSAIKVKNVTYSVKDLLKGSAYKEKFKEGIFTHSFLRITDYHHFHMPVAGIIKEVKIVPASTWVNAIKKPDGSLENIDDVGFQFTHTRGYVIIDSPAGYVAVIPVGMGHISSVNITAEEDASLIKGEEFGCFAFGGSDIIMLFQKDRVAFNAKERKLYSQGEQIARAI